MKQKQTSLSVLKIAAIILIIAQHTITSGGIKIPFWSSNLLYTFSFNGVAIFAMLSGYFTIDAKEMKNRWLYILLYGIPLLIISSLLDMNWTKPSSQYGELFVQGLFKVSWYYISIIFVFALAPIFSYVYKTLDAGKWYLLIVLIVLIGTTLPFTIGRSASMSPDNYTPWEGLNFTRYFNDMSFVPLLIWFLLGATIKMFNLYEGFWKTISGKLVNAFLILALLATLFLVLYFQKHGKVGQIFYSIKLVFVALISFTLIGLFKNFSFHNKSLDWAGGQTLFIYLMHPVQIALVMWYCNSWEHYQILMVALIFVGFFVWLGLSYVYDLVMKKPCLRVQMKLDNYLKNYKNRKGKEKNEEITK